MKTIDLEKEPVPKVSDIVSLVHSTPDNKALATYTNTAKENTQQLLDEISRQKKADGLVEALEEGDLNRLGDVYKNIHSTSIAKAGKELLVSALSISGYKIEDEHHVEETVGNWIMGTYEKSGIQGVLSLAEQIDIGLQVVDNYDVVFDSDVARQNRQEGLLNRQNTISINWGNYFNS